MNPKAAFRRSTGPMVVAGRSPRWFACFALVAALGLWTGRAMGTPLPVLLALEYSAGDGVACPNEEDVATQVQREVGHNIFAPNARRRVSLVIAGNDDELSANITFFDPHGAPQALRRIAAPAGQCGELVRAFALLVALHVQVVQSPNQQAPPSAQKVAPAAVRAPARTRHRKNAPLPAAPPQPPPAPKAVDLPPEDARIVVAVPPPIPAAAVPLRRRALWVYAGPIARTGLAPGMQPGAGVGVGWDITPTLRLHGQVDGASGRGQSANPLGAFDIVAGSSTASLCWSPLVRHRWTLGLCPTAALHGIRVAGRNLDAPRTDTAIGVTGGVNGRLSFFVSGPWAVDATLGMAYNPRPHIVRMGGVKVWNSDAFWLSAGLVLGYRFGPHGENR